MENKTLNIKTWYELKMYSPIDLTRVEYYYNEFKSRNFLPPSPKFLRYSEQRLIESRGYLTLLITTLIQNLYDKTILKKPEDIILYEYLKKYLSLLLLYITKQEDKLIVVHDNPDFSKGEVGTGRLSAYSTILNTIALSIYESLIKSIEEYYFLEEDKETKKNKRTFLYILYSILQITFSVMGGYSEEILRATNQKNPMSLNQQTPDYRYLMSRRGQDSLAEEYEKETGIKIEDIFSEEGTTDEIF